jgi:hypothetical protein
VQDVAEQAGGCKEAPERESDCEAKGRARGARGETETERETHTHKRFIEVENVMPQEFERQGMGGGEEGREGRAVDDCSPAYTCSDIGSSAFMESSPFGTGSITSFFSGFSEDGRDGFFPALLPGEGELLEEEQEVGGGAVESLSQLSQAMRERGCERFKEETPRESDSEGGGGGCHALGEERPRGSASLRSLHDKLMSPDRHRRHRPDEVLRKHDEKQRYSVYLLGWYSVCLLYWYKSASADAARGVLREHDEKHRCSV